MQDWVLLLFLLSNDVDMKVFRTILLWLNLFDFLMLCIALWVYLIFTLLSGFMSLNLLLSSILVAACEPLASIHIMFWHFSNYYLIFFNHFAVSPFLSSFMILWLDFSFHLLRLWFWVLHHWEVIDLPEGLFLQVHIDCQHVAIEECNFAAIMPLVHALGHWSWFDVCPADLVSWFKFLIEDILVFLKILLVICKAVQWAKKFIEHLD